MLPVACLCPNRPKAVERWLLHVHFEPLDVQVEIDPELEFPYDYASQFFAFLGRKYVTLPEDLQEFVRYESECVTVTGQTLDMLDESVSFLMLCTVPITIYLDRGSE